MLWSWAMAAKIGERHGAFRRSVALFVVSLPISLTPRKDMGYVHQQMNPQVVRVRARYIEGLIFEGYGKHDVLTKDMAFGTCAVSLSLCPLFGLCKSLIIYS